MCRLCELFSDIPGHHICLSGILDDDQLDQITELCQRGIGLSERMAIRFILLLMFGAIFIETNGQSFRLVMDIMIIAFLSFFGSLTVYFCSVVSKWNIRKHHLKWIIYNWALIIVYFLAYELFCLFTHLLGFDCVLKLSNYRLMTSAIVASFHIEYLLWSPLHSPLTFAD